MYETSTLIAHEGKITREQLATVPTPAPTETHRPIPHHEIAEALTETLGFRQIAILKNEFAVSKDGMKMFGRVCLKPCAVCTSSAGRFA